MASIKEMTSSFVKLDKFDGGNFRRWQKKMHFLLTTLNVAYVLTTPQPEEKEDETLAETRSRAKWENDEYICRGHILNGMSDALFDTYQSELNAKELWDQLEARYMREDATSKKFLVSQFNNYSMVDSRSVMEQFHEVERILGNFRQHNMNMDDSIIVSSIIDKLPPSWKEFKHSLKHKKEDLTLEELANHLRVEEEFRKHENKDQNIHMVNEGQSSKDKGKRKRDNFNKQNNNFKNKKKKFACWTCGGPHMKRDCKKTPSNSKPGKIQRAASNGNGNFAAMISEINMIQDDNDWWVDSGATRHVCKDKAHFKTYESVADPTFLYMGNKASVDVPRQRKCSFGIHFWKISYFE